jgi:hypothetical protein
MLGILQLIADFEHERIAAWTLRLNVFLFYLLSQNFRVGLFVGAKDCLHAG